MAILAEVALTTVLGSLVEHFKTCLHPLAKSHGRVPILDKIHGGCYEVGGLMWSKLFSSILIMLGTIRCKILY